MAEDLMTMSRWLLMVQPARDQAQEGISEACTLVLIYPVPLCEQCMALRSWSVNTRQKEMNSGP